MYTHSNHIPQPPHSAGLDYKGLRPRIDSAQVPSPIEAIELDRQAWETKLYMTLPGTHTPLCTSDFVAVDQGNSSPKFVRVSTWNMPSTSRLVSDSHFPVAAVFQPFADLDPREEPVPLVDTGSTGPARCATCRAYINPWCTWVAGGVRWKCNLCSHETEVSPEYFCNLDANLLRLDHLQRPELNKGTIDFDVTSAEEYWAQNPPPHIAQPFSSVEGPPKGPRAPAPLEYVFAFDVSNEAVVSGFLQSVCDALKVVLFGSTNANGAIEDSHFPPSSKIAIVTFDSTLHFYDLTSEVTQMLVVGDLDEVFIPTLSLFVNPVEHRPAIEALLDGLPGRFYDAMSTNSALGSAIRGGLAALAGRGGHIVLFQTTLPNVGAGALPLTPPSETTLYDTDKEKTLHSPRDSTWISIGEECADEGVGVSMFLAPSKYMDTGSVCVVSNLTGGEVFWHPRFVLERDAAIVRGQLSRLVGRMQGYNCMVRIRCSHGLQVKEHYGLFLRSTPTELTFAQLSSDSAFCAELEHTRNLSTRSYAYLQCAVLYTSVDGQRRVRVVNLAVNVVELAGSLFQFADMETVLCHLAKEAMSSMSQQRSLLIREELTEKCANLLLGYRTQCAAATRPSQLIIPEAFRALPAYTLALQKTKPLKARQVSSDVRNYHIHRILGMSTRTLMSYLYPQLIALHDLNDTIALPHTLENEDGTTIEKVLMPAYNEEMMIFWVGSSVSPQILSDLFGVDDVHSLNPHMHTLPVLPTTLSTQVHNILAHRYAQRGKPTKMYIARQNLDAAEVEYSDMLVEDQNNGAMSYLDCKISIPSEMEVIELNFGHAPFRSCSFAYANIERGAFPLSLRRCLR
ncbi:sec24-related protein [Flammula alnicola]|nr:sec24-related protein [Flammula alnicola]